MAELSNVILNGKTVTMGNLHVNRLTLGSSNNQSLTISSNTNAYYGTKYTASVYPITYTGKMFLCGTESTTTGLKSLFFNPNVYCSGSTVYAASLYGTVTNATKLGGQSATYYASTGQINNWWAVESTTFSRSTSVTGTISASSLRAIGPTVSLASAISIGIKKLVGTNIYDENIGGDVTWINGIKVGDYLFDNNGAIATVTGYASTTTNTTVTTAGVPIYPVTISYRVTWISNAQWTCLEEGTMITMADWSRKPIEDVKSGELIMGYDFENNEPTPAVAIINVPTVDLDRTDYYVFENGEYLSCTEDHEIYCSERKCHCFARELEEGQHCIDIDGNEIEIYAIHRNINRYEFKQYYQLISSNNTYFANNIMNAMGPANKHNWVEYGARLNIPDEIMEIFKLDAVEYNSYEFLGENEEFRKKSLDVMEKLKLKSNRIQELKNYLTDTDYIAIKKSEGQEIDENIIEQRQKNRDEINKLEEELNTIYWPEHNRLLAENSELGDDILLSNEERRSKYFFEACKRDNENFELFKKYYAYK